MAAVFKWAFLLFTCSLFFYGLYDYLTNYESNSCEMTYMWETPEYIKVPLEDTITARFSRYSLYFYGEGKYAAESSSKFKLSGIPVLFLPGNAGSYRQVRSLGSVALRKSNSLKTKFHFNYFSADFNEEISALYGGYLKDQTEFVVACIRRILTMYEGITHPPKSVVIVGHSMGGVVARGLFTVPGFDHSLVHTIITQATPHQAPVVALDAALADYYSQVNTYWRTHKNTTLKDVTVVTSGGGYRDLLVRTGLTPVFGLVEPNRAISTSTMTIPMAWASTDHLCHVWCKQVALVTKRALFDAVDPSTNQMAVNPEYRMKAFRSHFVDNPGFKKVKKAYDTTVAVPENIEWSTMFKRAWTLTSSGASTAKFMALAHTESTPMHFVAISNLVDEGWLGFCHPAKRSDRCKELTNYAPMARLIPPLYSGRKVITLEPEQMGLNTHAVFALPSTTERVEVYAEFYEASKRHIEHNMTTFLQFLMSFPRGFWKEEPIIRSTEHGALFYNISLRGLELPLQPFVATLKTRKCTDNNSQNFAGALMKLFIPWSNEHTYKFVKQGGNGSLSLLLPVSPPPGNHYTAQLHLYLNPSCTYHLSIRVSAYDYLGQAFRLYSPFVIVFMVIQLLMIFSWQMKVLESKPDIPSVAEALAHWGKPYRVTPIAMLVRFLFCYPEEKSITALLGLVEDDTAVLSRLGVWYALSCLLLYLLVFAVMQVTIPLIYTPIAVWGRIAGRLDLPIRLSSLGKLEYPLLAVALVLSATVCGSLGIIIVYVLQAVRTVTMWTIAHYYSREQHAPVAWSRFNVNFTLTLLYLALMVLNAAPFIAWIQNFQYSLVVPNDPSGAIGVATVLCALMFKYSHFPAAISDFYGLVGNITWLSCVLMVLYCIASVYRVTYFVLTSLLIAASSSVLIGRSPVHPPPQDKVKDAETSKTEDMQSNEDSEKKKKVEKDSTDDENDTAKN